MAQAPKPGDLTEQLPLKFLPSSPTTTAFTQFGQENDVNLMTGAVQVGIPLPTVRRGSLQLPVSLSYTYNGLQVQQALELIGLGWRLQAGGSITHQIRGILDDDSYNQATLIVQARDTNFLQRQDFLRNIAQGKRGFDTQPDLFTINLPEYSGSFIRSKNAFTLVSGGPVKITSTSEGYVITLPSGTIYHFNTPEFSTPHPNNFSQIGKYAVNWQLTSIVSASRQDTIRLHYSAAPHEDPQRMAMTVIRRTRALGCGPPDDHLQRVTQYGTPMELQILDSISTRHERVVFLRGQGALASSRVLHAVRHYSLLAGRRLVRSFALTHSYFEPGSAAKRLRLDAVVESGSIPQAPGNSLPAHRFTYLAESERPMPLPQSLGQDHWGFYNGKNQNPTLMPFTQVAFAADRNPDFAAARQGALTQIRYPTGGTKSFEYEPNKYASTPDTTFQYNEVSAATTSYAGSDTIVSSPGNPNVTTTVKQQHANFSLSQETRVQMVVSREWRDDEDADTRSGNFNQFADAALYAWTGSRYTLFRPAYKVRRSDPEEPANANTYTEILYLPAGKYRIIAFCERLEKVNTCTARLEREVIIREKTGPGIRVKQTTMRDGLASSHNVLRSYDYTSNNISSGELLQLTIRKGKNKGDVIYNKELYTYGFASDMNSTTWLCPYERISSTVGSIDSTFDSSQQKNIHFYRSVTESTLVNDQPHGKLKTTYENYPKQQQDVKLIRKEAYSFYDNTYHCIKRDRFHYSQELLDSLFVLKTYSLREAEIKAGIISGLDKVYGISKNFSYLYFSALDTSSVITYGTAGANLLSTITTTLYKNRLPFQQIMRASDGSRLVEQYKYLQDYNPSRPELQFLRKRYFNPVVEQQSWRIPAGQTARRLLTGTITLYDTVAYAPSQVLQLEDPVASNQFSAEQLDSQGFYTHLISDARYRPQVEIAYTAAALTAQITPAHQRPNAYNWGYGSTQPVAATKNAALKEIAYAGFEQRELGRWQGTGSFVAGGYTGQMSYRLGTSTQLRCVNLPSMTYLLSCWLENGSGSLQLNGQPLEATAVERRGWRLYQRRVVVGGDGMVTLTGSGRLDELRLHPAEAQMTSYTYEPLVGLSSQTGPDNRTIFYEYDALGRLLRVRDEQNRVLSENEYQYATQP